MDHNNLCPFCMREIPEPTDEPPDESGFATLIQAIGQIVLALSTAKTLLIAMKERNDEGEPR